MPISRFAIPEVFRNLEEMNGAGLVIRVMGAEVSTRRLREIPLYGWIDSEKKALSDGRVSEHGICFSGE